MWIVCWFVGCGNLNDFHLAILSAEMMVPPRRLQVRNDALCALQATLEAPKDESFGPAVRKALQEAGCDFLERGRQANGLQ